MQTYCKRVFSFSPWPSYFVASSSDIAHCWSDWMPIEIKMHFWLISLQDSDWNYKEGAHKQNFEEKKTSVATNQ